MNNTELHKDKVVKHKLNMLGPGMFMMKVIGVFAALGLLFWAFEWNKLCIASLAVAGGVTLILFLLLVFEAYQNNCLDELFIWRDDEEVEDY